MIQSYTNYNKMLKNKENKKQEITLSLKEAKELYKTADKTFKQFLETNFSKQELSDDICELINDLDDVFEILDEDINDYLLFPLNTKNIRERYLNACSLIPKIVECYNQGEELNWKNSNVYKYYPYKYSSGGSWSVSFFADCTALCSSGLFYYKLERLAKDGYNKFKKYYEDYWVV